MTGTISLLETGRYGSIRLPDGTHFRKYAVHCHFHSGEYNVIHFVRDWENRLALLDSFHNEEEIYHEGPSTVWFSTPLECILASERKFPRDANTLQRIQKGYNRITGVR